MAEAKRPKVGVGVVIHDGEGNIVMGERVSSHGAGTLQCPGGHLEHTESFATCAIREVAEETGLSIGDIRFLVATNDVMHGDVDAEGAVKHYVTVFVTGRVVGGDAGRGVPKALEPHKCPSWSWIPWRQMWAWSLQQAEAEQKMEQVGRPMFRPLVNLVCEYPELEGCLEGR